MSNCIFHSLPSCSWTWLAMQSYRTAFCIQLSVWLLCLNKFVSRNGTMIKTCISFSMSKTWFAGPNQKLQTNPCRFKLCIADIEVFWNVLHSVFFFNYSVDALWRLTNACVQWPLQHAPHKPCWLKASNDGHKRQYRPMWLTFCTCSKPSSPNKPFRHLYL